MSIGKLRKRGRIVSFRVSEDEYLNLCRATESAGAESISDFARHVACNHSLVYSQAGGGANGDAPNTPVLPLSKNGKITEVHVAPALVIQVTQLHKRVEELQQQVQTLTKRVNRGI